MLWCMVHQKDWLKYAKMGLQRKSSMILMDYCGFPRWFVRWYCPRMKGWGTLLGILSDGIAGKKGE